jgi:hypothetical protein
MDLAWQWTPDVRADEQELAEAARHQRVQFATAPDGVQIAWASIGEGPSVLKAPNWLNHLDYEWRSPIWGPVLHCTGDRVAPLQGEGRDIARLIEGASFIELPGNNHVLLTGTPAFDRFLEDATEFVAAHAH